MTKSKTQTKMIELVQNDSQIADRALLAKIPVSRRQIVAQALRRLFPWAMVNIASDHVAVVQSDGRRFVTVTGTGGDWGSAPTEGGTTQ